MKTLILMSCAAAMFAAAGCEDECHAGECHEDAGAAVDSATLSPAESYCNCMLTSCHDQYHAHFGPDSDEPAARAACLSEAAALPSVGSDVATGNSIECRMHFCVAGRTDEAMCPPSIGGPPCE
jgi:hypothetical protein